MPDVHIVLFSFNRAMQCDSVLRSIQKHIGEPGARVSVVWHADESHHSGYQKLRDLHTPRGVGFRERRRRPSFARDTLPRLRRPRNLYHWLSHDYLRNGDDFQPLVEELVRESPEEFVCFNTDDTVYYRHEDLPEAAFDRIRRDPLRATYRTYVGQNLGDCPDLPAEDGVVLWDYADPNMHDHWAYPFAVDGTFYEKRALSRFLRRVLYHNPITLEAYGCMVALRGGWFLRGSSPCVSSMVSQPLNKVNHICAGNLHGNASVERLNELFLDGYVLDYGLPSELTVSGFVPQRVWAVRGSERIEIPVRVGK